MEVRTLSRGINDGNVDFHTSIGDGQNLIPWLAPGGAELLIEALAQISNRFLIQHTGNDTLGFSPCVVCRAGVSRIALGESQNAFCQQCLPVNCLHYIRERYAVERSRKSKSAAGSFLRNDDSAPVQKLQNFAQEVVRNSKRIGNFTEKNAPFFPSTGEIENRLNAVLARP